MWSKAQTVQYHSTRHQAGNRVFHHNFGGKNMMLYERFLLTIIGPAIQRK